MPSFTTIYRAIVMIAAGVIVVKGWQLYGPTNEQVKSFGLAALEKAQAAWDKWQPTESDPAVRDDPRLVAAPASASIPPSIVEPAPLLSPTTETLELTNAAVSNAALTPNGGEDRLPQLYSRLEAMGVSNPQLVPWGSGGQLYRFCCRAALAETPAFSRHFEAVAAEPVSAVEQVVAKVEAWRAIQRDGTALQ